MNESLLVDAAIVRGFELFDAAWGVPFNVATPQKRLAAFQPAMQMFGLAAVQWAIEAALATLEKHPAPAQLRRLAQASPAYHRAMQLRKPPEDKPELHCGVCNEPRAQHRYRPEGAPRPFIAVLVRHREDCPMNTPLPWADPPRYGQLQLDEESWDVERGGDPVRLYTPELLGPRPEHHVAPTDPRVDQAARDRKAAEIKQGVRREP